MEHQELLAGFVRLHVLHHASEHEVYGLWMIEELGRHGYRLSPGTLYPMLHAMEKRGYLTSRVQRVGSTSRKLYRATALGAAGLKVARERMKELTGEVGRHETAKSTKKPSRTVAPRQGVKSRS